MPLTEADITLVCVSNQVGGTYNGNARWLGVPLAGLLRRAGVRAGADQVLSSATDGMTISTPVETIMDGPLLAGRVGTRAAGGGDERPAAAGRARLPGPPDRPRAVRLRVRDQVGHQADPDHVRAAEGLLDAARLHRPGAGQDRVPDRRAQAAGQVKAGPVTVAGVAWAPHKGIAAVEVSTDNGPWHRPRWPPPTASTPGGSGAGTGTPPPACTRCACGPPTRPARRRHRSAPARSQRRERLGLHRGDRHVTALHPRQDITPFGKRLHDSRRSP